MQFLLRDARSFASCSDAKIQATAGAASTSEVAAAMAASITALTTADGGEPKMELPSDTA